MNAAKLRAVIKRCAKTAQEQHPDDLDMRSRAFASRLTGSLECLGDVELASVVWRMTSSTPLGLHVTLQAVAVSAAVADEVDRLADHRLCANCVHVRLSSRAASSACMAPGAMTLNVVTGLEPTWCSAARELAGPCGVGARLYSPKPEAQQVSSVYLARSSSMIQRAAAPSSASTAPTTAGEDAGPKTDSQIA